MTPTLGRCITRLMRENTRYALGLLLGQEAAVRHLRLDRNPSLRATNSDEAHSRRVEAQSLDNFVLAATRVVGISHDEKAIEWNLDCVGQLGIHGSYIQVAGAATFYVLRNKGIVLQVLGIIESGFAIKVRQAIERNPSVEVVSLGSGGGSVYEAIQAGRYIRSKGLATTLWNNCYSACPLVFAGGVSPTGIDFYGWTRRH